MSTCRNVVYVLENVLDVYAHWQIGSGFSLKRISRALRVTQRAPRVSCQDLVSLSLSLSLSRAPRLRHCNRGMRILSFRRCTTVLRTGSLSTRRVGQKLEMARARNDRPTTPNDTNVERRGIRSKKPDRSISREYLAARFHVNGVSRGGGVSPCLERVPTRVSRRRLHRVEPFRQIPGISFYSDAAALDTLSQRRIARRRKKLTLCAQGHHRVHHR